jgi:hypothetical protein
MIVGLLIAGAIVAVSTMQSPQQETAGVREGERLAADFLALYAALPPQSTDKNYANRLEELIVEHLAGRDQTLSNLLAAHGLGSPRLYIDADGRTLHVYGQASPPGSGGSTGTSTFWHSTMGTTILSPTMSLHNTSMPIVFDVLPVANHRLPAPSGIPYVVEADLSADGFEARTAATFYARAPVEDQSPVLIEPVSGGIVRHVYSEAEVQGGSGYSWTLRFRITPAPPVDRQWLDDGTFMRLEVPRGWDVALEDPSNWTRVNGAESPYWLIQYEGRSFRGSGTAWMNATLSRPLDVPIRHHEHVTLRQHAPGYTVASAVLTPTAATREVPAMISLSQPGPLPVDGPVEIRFTLTNPSGAPVDVDRFEAVFPALHQFRHEPADWTRTESSGKARYAYVGATITIPAYGASTLTLPMRMEKNDGDNRPVMRPIIVEYLGEGALSPPHRDGQLEPAPGEEVPFFVALPRGEAGRYLAHLSADGLAAGVHTARIGGDATSRIPAGAAGFTVTDASAAALLDLQEARHSMTIAIDKSRVRYGDGLNATLEMGTLGDFLAAAPLADETLRVRVTGSDLVSHLSGRPQYTKTTTHNAADFVDVDPFPIPAPKRVLPGVFVVTVDVTIDLIDVGPVDLRFVAVSFRTAEGLNVNPAFLSAHLHYLTPSS